MARLTRRKALQTGGSAILAGLAGCSSFNRDASSTLTLGEMGVLNLDFRPHTVSVAILDDNEPVYWSEMKASAAEPEGDDSSSVATAGGGSFEGFPAEVGEYLLSFVEERIPAFTPGVNPTTPTQSTADGRPDIPRSSTPLS